MATARSDAGGRYELVAPASGRYAVRVEDPEGFWAEMANAFLSWEAPWQQVVSYDFRAGEAQWFAGGKLNVSHNCIDRHLPERADQTALIWEGHGEKKANYSFDDLRLRSNAFGQLLRDLGVDSGERVALFMDRVPELYVTQKFALNAAARAAYGSQSCSRKSRAGILTICA